MFKQSEIDWPRAEAEGGVAIPECIRDYIRSALLAYLVASSQPPLSKSYSIKKVSSALAKLRKRLSGRSPKPLQVENFIPDLRVTQHCVYIFDEEGAWTPEDAAWTLAVHRYQSYSGLNATETILPIAPDKLAQFCYPLGPELCFSFEEVNTSLARLHEQPTPGSWRDARLIRMTELGVKFIDFDGPEPLAAAARSIVLQRYRSSSPTPAPIPSQVTAALCHPITDEDRRVWAHSELTGQPTKPMLGEDPIGYLLVQLGLAYELAGGDVYYDSRVRDIGPDEEPSEVHRFPRFALILHASLPDGLRIASDLPRICQIISYHLERNKFIFPPERLKESSCKKV